MDEDDSEKNQKTKKQRKSVNFLQRFVSNVGDVFSSIWVRRIIQIDDGGNWFVLGSRYNFLLYFRVFLVVLYFAYETFK